MSLEPKQLTAEKVMKEYNLKYLPRTGIEQPYMIQPPKFIENHKEFEPIAHMNVSQSPKLKVCRRHLIKNLKLKSSNQA